MNKPSVSWRPMTTVILIVGLVSLLVYSVAAYAISNFQPTVEVKIGGGVYHLRVADTESDRVQGLSGVEKLEPNGGLLMKYDADGMWGIWMKDMKIPLDIIWLDKDKKVVYIVKNASADLSTDVVFTPKSAARYVLELPAGSVDKAAIKSGVTAEFDETSDGSVW